MAMRIRISISVSAELFFLNFIRNCGVDFFVISLNILWFCLWQNLSGR